MKRTLMAALGIAVLLPVVASALTTSDLQAQIAALLQQVAALQAQMSAQSTTPSSTGTPVPRTTTNLPVGGVCPQLIHTIMRGASGSDVQSLQQFLVAQGLMNAGDVSGYFGAATEGAVQTFQAKANIVSSGSAETTGWGSVGPRTRRLMALNCSVPQNITATTAPAGTVATPPPAGGANSCAIAQRPNVACSGVWQAVADSTGCTTAWQCAVPLVSNAPAVAPNPYGITCSTGYHPSGTACMPDASCPVYTAQAMACPSGQHGVAGAVTYDANGCAIPSQTCVAN